MDISLIYIYI